MDDRNQNDVLQDDLRDMLRALGMPDCARSESPHLVFRDCIKAVERLRMEQLMPTDAEIDAGAEALLMDFYADLDVLRWYRERPVRLSRWRELATITLVAARTAISSTGCE